MENNIDWSKWVCRGSAVGYIMTEPRSKESKEKGELGETVKKYLIKEYAYHKFGKECVDLKTKPILNGKATEEDIITLISRLDKVIYNKNDKRLYNSHFSGEPDIFLGKSIENATYIIDVKSSYTIQSFLENLVVKELNPIYEYQLQTYFSLTTAPEGECSYCLNNMDMKLLNDERRKLLYSLDAVTEESPEYIEAEKRLVNTFTYDDIPKEFKRLRFKVTRDNDTIEKMKLQVEKCRVFLKELETKHLNFNNISPTVSEPKVNKLLNKIKQQSNE